MPERATIYGVEDSITFVSERLAPGTELRERDVRHILEWAVRYLQDAEVREDPATPPVLASPEMAGYVLTQAAIAGREYEPSAVAAVLELQAAYVAAIGGVGDPVDGSTERPPSTA